MMMMMMMFPREVAQGYVSARCDSNAETCAFLVRRRAEKIGALSDPNLLCNR